MMEMSSLQKDLSTQGIAKIGKVCPLRSLRFSVNFALETVFVVEPL